MSKRIFVDVTDGVEDLDYCQIDIRDIDNGVYILGFEHYREDIEIAKSEFVVGKENLKELRDALDLMIGDES